MDNPDKTKERKLIDEAATAKTEVDVHEEKKDAPGGGAVGSSEETTEDLLNKIIDMELKNRPRIFKDKSALSINYVPQKILCRDNEITTLAGILTPILDGEQPKNVFIYGKPGTGKTIVAQRVSKHLSGVIENIDNLIMEVKIYYLNCREFHTTYKILFEVLRHRNVPRHGWGTENFYNELRKEVTEFTLSSKHFKKEGVGLTGYPKRFIIILDEIDCVKDIGDLIYILSRDKIFLETISIIGISNTLTFRDKIDRQTQSGLFKEDIVFRPYNALDIAAILNQRIDLAFQPGVVMDETVKYIAALAAQDGDARMALKILEKSGTIAQQMKKEEVTNYEVDLAKGAVLKDVLYEAVVNLPEHHIIVLNSVSALLPKKDLMHQFQVFTGEVYTDYSNKCKYTYKVNPKTLQWFGTCLTDLSSLGLIAHRASGQGFRGRSTGIKCAVEPDYLREITEGVLRQKISF